MAMSRQTHMDIIDGWIATNNWTAARFDRRMGFSAGYTSKIISDHQRLTSKVALQIEQETGLDALDLMFRQTEYELEIEREKVNRKRSLIEHEQPLSASQREFG